MKLFSSRLASSAMSFAHLASVGARARAEDDDEEEKKEARAESDDEKKDDESQDRDDGDSKKGKKASAEDPDAEDDDEDENGKNAAAAAAEDDEPRRKDDDEDDDKEEMHGKSAVARARLREQARCAAIFNCRAAARNVQLAATLAFNTRLTAEEAVTVLQNTPAATNPARDSRALRNPSLGGGGSAGAMDSKAATMAGWDRAFKKATASNPSHH